MGKQTEYNCIVEREVDNGSTKRENKEYFGKLY